MGEDAVVNEVWKPLPGHLGYEVSNRGRVRSYRNRQGHPTSAPRILTPAIVHGYSQIKIGRGRQTKVHVLMLEAFVGPRPDGMVCRHLDGNPQHNVLTNLRWGTPEENYADRHGHGTDNTGVRNGRARIDEAMVRQIRDLLAVGRRQLDIAQRFGISRSIVAHISAGRTWTHVQ
ncbi:NUMOD4 motif-containing HNH endonuclease [Streptomyces microflavus]|uniref:NUMOD4 motif-containing HNH endonuclease n=1 Tax=Streptomyces microflavus TaxID=1919 RepID=UPI0036A6E597